MNGLITHYLTIQPELDMLFKRKQRPLLFVSQEQEQALIQKLMYQINASSYHPDTHCVLMVSPDYSATVSQQLAHAWSKDRDKLHIEAVHVPYPDEDPEPFRIRFKREFNHYKDNFKHFILVEAGIIRGSNWKMLTESMIELGVDKSRFTTVTLFENVYSQYKSDYVGQYYDNNKIDLTFWWERDNKHWDGK
jgi:hypothetical protein